MVVKSLGTLDTIRLKLSPFLPRPQAMLYFLSTLSLSLYTVLKTVCLIQYCFGGGEGH